MLQLIRRLVFQAFLLLFHALGRFLCLAFFFVLHSLPDPSSRKPLELAAWDIQAELLQAVALGNLCLVTSLLFEVLSVALLDLLERGLLDAHELPTRRLEGAPNADVVQVLDVLLDEELHFREVLVHHLQVVHGPVQGLYGFRRQLFPQFLEVASGEAEALGGLEHVSGHGGALHAHKSCDESLHGDLAAPVVQDVENIGQLLEVDVEHLHHPRKVDVHEHGFELLRVQGAGAVLVQIEEHVPQ
mmetsp:Transcript_101157/g.290259  ORF Transcript_101157/g.290259 Transcript_101157/m.290259 type:complete len:244 (+) Transcript_101157:259-990(+)